MQHDMLQVAVLVASCFAVVCCSCSKLSDGWQQMNMYNFNDGWQQINSDDFKAGWTEDINLAPFTNAIPGYALRVQLRGHHTCSCQRSQIITIWRRHNDAAGDWPVNYRVSTEYGNSFLRANPNMDRGAGQLPDPSYGTLLPGTRVHWMIDQ